MWKTRQEVIAIIQARADIVWTRVVAVEEKK